jgi:hypothetical protein
MVLNTENAPNMKEEYKDYIQNYLEYRGCTGKAVVKSNVFGGMVQEGQYHVNVEGHKYFFGVWTVMKDGTGYFKSIDKPEDHEY